MVQSGQFSAVVQVPALLNIVSRKRVPALQIANVQSGYPLPRHDMLKSGHLNYSTCPDALSEIMHAVGDNSKG